MQQVQVKCQGADLVDYKLLVPFQGDLKVMAAEDKARLKSTIANNGFTAPMHVWKGPDGALYTLDGHQRCITLDEMAAEGWEMPQDRKFPVDYILADSHEHAKRIVLSHASVYGKINEPALKSYLLENNIDPKLLTVEFSLPALEPMQFLKENFPTQVNFEAGDKDPDAVPEVPKIIRSKFGEIYALGRHRLMCGDMADTEQVARLMNGERANLLCTDPPYGVSYVEKNAAVHGGVVLNAIGKKIDNDSLDVDGMYKLWCALFNLDQFFEDKASYYVFSPQGGELMMMMMMQAIHQSQWQLKHTLVWAKQNFVFGRADYHYQHEPVLYGWKKRGTHLWYADRKQSSLLQFDKAQRNDLHPTSKPVALIEYLIGNSSQPEDLVADFFGGSGTALIACEKTARRCFMMELDPSYCDVIVSRWEQFSGKKAELLP